ncbi:MAG: SIMPL domain-containing protein [Novosphingobium sp.]
MDRKHVIALSALCALPLLIAASASDTQDDSRYTRVTVSGVGYSSQIEETTTITAGADSFATSASGAMRDNASSMDRLRSRLAGLGVSKDDFRTASFQFRQGRNPEPNSDERGFVVSHQLTIVVRNPDKVGQVLDALAAAGATNLGVQRGWGYGGDIDPKSLHEARGEAIRDAQVKAEDYARALNMKVRRVVSVNDQFSYVRDAPAPVARFGIADAETKIDKRPSTVLANVGMVFELEK